jgi:MraZ protein
MPTAGVSSARSESEGTGGPGMPVLVGRYINRIDRKGRVSVPKSYRDFLQLQGGFAGIYAFALINEPGIEGCGEAFMSRLADSVEQFGLFSDDHDEFALALLESAHQLPFDPEGRITLPAELVDHAGLDGEVLFVGRGGRFQMWRPETYQRHREELMARLKARGATLQLKSQGEVAR